MRLVLLGHEQCAPCRALKPLVTAAAESLGLALDYYDVTKSPVPPGIPFYPAVPQVWLLDGGQVFMRPIHIEGQFPTLTTVAQVTERITETQSYGPSR